MRLERLSQQLKIKKLSGLKEADKSKKKPTQSESIANALYKIDISAIENPPEVDVNDQIDGLDSRRMDTDRDVSGNDALDAEGDSLAEALDLNLLKTLQGLAYDVLINTEFNSTALVMITLQTIDEFLISEVQRPRII